MTPEPSRPLYPRNAVEDAGLANDRILDLIGHAEGPQVNRGGPRAESVLRRRAAEA
jgi:hypothetical protein